MLVVARVGAEVEALTVVGTGRGIVLYKDMHPLQGEDAIPLPSLRPLKSVARQLTLLWMRMTANHPNQFPDPQTKRKMQLLKHTRTRRWVVTHRRQKSTVRPPHTFCSDTVIRFREADLHGLFFIRIDLLPSRPRNYERDSFVRK